MIASNCAWVKWLSQFIQKPGLRIREQRFVVGQSWVGVGVLVGVSVGVLVGVFIGVFVGVSVGVLVGVSVGVSVGVLVGVLVGSLPGQTWLKLKNVLSPSEVAEPASSVSGVGVQM